MSDIVGTSSAVDVFLKEVQSNPTKGGGRLIFAVDATASREATWDTVCKLQVEVPRRGGDRWAGGAAGLLSRHRRVPGLEMGE